MIDDIEDLKNSIENLKNNIIAHSAMISRAINDREREKWAEELECLKAELKELEEELEAKTKH